MSALVTPGTWVAVVPSQSDVLLRLSTQAHFYRCLEPTFLSALLDAGTARGLTGVRSYPTLSAALESADETDSAVLEVTARGEVVYQHGNALEVS